LGAGSGDRDPPSAGGDLSPDGQARGESDCDLPADGDHYRGSDRFGGAAHHQTAGPSRDAAAIAHRRNRHLDEQCSGVCILVLATGRRSARDRQKSHNSGAFLFPQMQMRDHNWKPGFVDYLFLAFNTSTAFSPTDVPVLSRWAKFMMMVQSSISLGTVVILAARAVNIL
jgi:hypothetical protein